MNKVVVYTAIMGSFDTIKEPLKITPNVDYFCFTDNENLKSDTWNIIYLQKCENSRKVARKLKVLGHDLINNYKYSIWVDGNIQIKEDLTKQIEEYFYLQAVEIATFKHPVRNCIYDEAVECSFAKADSPKAISKQVKYLIKQNYPINNGLVESNVLFRNNESAKTKEFCKQWWYFIDNITIRDQLSFNYVLGVVDVKFLYLDGDTRGNSSYFEWKKHRNKSYLYKLVYKISAFMLDRV